MTRFTTRSRDRPLTWPARERVYKARWTSRPQTLARHGSSGEHSRCSVSHLLSSFCLLSLLLPFFYIFLSLIFSFFISPRFLSLIFLSPLLFFLLFYRFSFFPLILLPSGFPISRSFSFFSIFLKAVCGKTGKLRNCYIWNQRLRSSEERGLCENIGDINCQNVAKWVNILQHLVLYSYCDSTLRIIYILSVLE